MKIFTFFLKINLCYSFSAQFPNKILKNYKNKITVADYIIERLKDKNINKVFGYNGGAILPFFDKIYKHNDFDIIVNRHEQSSGHCAEGFAKVANNLGVLITTSGPGLTNVVTPLQDAYSDGIPLLCISGQVNSKTLGTDAFQECNAIEITKSCVKGNKQITSTKNFVKIFEDLLILAEQPRKGPVHLDICKDIFTDYIDLTTFISDITVYELSNPKKLKYKISDDLISQFIEFKARLNNSKKPIIIAGAGAINSYKILRRFINKFKIPTTTTLHGLGVVDEYDELSLNMIGMHGSYEANMALCNSDLIIGIGNRFDDRTIGKLSEFGINARHGQGIIHIDNSIDQINKVKNLINPDLSICIEVETLIKFINNYYYDEYVDRSPWINQINNYRESFKLKYDPNLLTSNYIMYILSKVLKSNDNYILTTGVGSHQMVVAQYFKHRYPNKLLTSGSLGTMGSGLGFAIGAQIANPNSTVILIDGDGSFTMSSNDLATIKEYNLPIKIILMNDKKLKMVDMWQGIFYKNRKIGSSFNYEIDFNKLADCYDIKNFFCDNNDILSNLYNMITYDGPVLFNCMIDKSICLPFVPNNTTLSSMILDKN